jgi:CubicO group peptidase (beta-lactamase class C family)
VRGLAGVQPRRRCARLLTHTSGLDADLFFPVAEGSGALAAYLEGLGRHCGTLFSPGEYVSYSNGGMIAPGACSRW